MSRLILTPLDGFADVYTMITLYDFLVSREFQADLVFDLSGINNGFYETTISDKLIQTIGERRKENEVKQDISSDIVLTGFCDVIGSLKFFCEKNIAIDHSILKNCVNPLTEEERKNLREKYNIGSDNKIVVIGVPSFISLAEKILLCDNASKLGEYAKIYVVGSTGESIEDYILQDRAEVIKAQGVLKDYYAMSDLALVADNLGNRTGYNRKLHNFIESTEGGICIFSQPYDTRQYGCRELLKLGVIRNAEDNADLITQAKEYLTNPKGEELRDKRRQHLEHSRRLYLNDILKLLNKTFGFSNDIPQSDLDVEIFRQDSYTTCLRVSHPETNWTQCSLGEKIEINKIPEEVYQGFRGKK